MIKAPLSRSLERFLKLAKRCELIERYHQSLEALRVVLAPTCSIRNTPHHQNSASVSRKSLSFNIFKSSMNVIQVCSIKTHHPHPQVPSPFRVAHISRKLWAWV